MSGATILMLVVAAVASRSRGPKVEPAVPVGAGGGRSGAVLRAVDPQYRAGPWTSCCSAYCRPYCSTPRWTAPTSTCGLTFVRWRCCPWVWCCSPRWWWARWPTWWPATSWAGRWRWSWGQSFRCRTRCIPDLAVARTLKLPRRILTILSGEGLLNDATALTAYRIVLIAALGGGVSIWHGLGLFVLAVVVGVGVGLALGMIGAWFLCKLSDSLVEVAIFLLLPFGAYALAEQLHGSGVLAVVSAKAILIGRKLPKMHYATRLQGSSVTKTVDFVLETLVFGLIGLQLLRRAGVRTVETTRRSPGWSSRWCSPCCWPGSSGCFRPPTCPVASPRRSATGRSDRPPHRPVRADGRGHRLGRDARCGDAGRRLRDPAGRRTTANLLEGGGDLGAALCFCRGVGDPAGAGPDVALVDPPGAAAVRRGPGGRPGRGADGAAGRRQAAVERLDELAGNRTAYQRAHRRRAAQFGRVQGQRGLGTARTAG